MDIITEKDIARITPSVAEINGSRYRYVMNTVIRNAPVIEKAAQVCKLDIIFGDNAYDMNFRLMPDSYAVYIPEEDYSTGTCMSKLIGTSVRISKEYLSRMIAEGKLRPDTPLHEFYPGCENDPEFPYIAHSA